MRQIPHFHVPMGILPLGLDPLPFSQGLRNNKGKGMKDADSAKRIAKLKQVMHEDFDGVQARLAAKLEIQPDYLSRMFKGTKGLSGDKAREYEQKLGKPRYYLDGDQPQLALAPAPTVDPQIGKELSMAAELMAIYARSSADHRQAILDLAKALEADRDSGHQTATGN